MRSTTSRSRLAHLAHPRVLMLVLVLAACAVSPPPLWPEQVDITVAPGRAAVAPDAGHPVFAAPLAAGGARSAPGGAAAAPGSAAAAPASDVMLCLVDPEGQARCHHRDGVLRGRATASGEATCPGADARLAGACQDPAQCTLRAIPAPPGTLGILVVDLQPPLFGVPRHAVAEAAVLSADASAPGDHSRIASAVHALARCLAPSDRRLADTDIPLLSRQACEDQPCALTRLTLRLARPRPATRVGFRQP